MKGLCALPSFEFLDLISEDQMRALITSIFKSAPAAHATAMFATIADTIAIDGIYPSAPDGNEEARRERYRRSIDYRFVEACMLIWKYRLNIGTKKDVEEYYKKKAFTQFRTYQRDPSTRRSWRSAPAHTTSPLQTPRAIPKTLAPRSSLQRGWRVGGQVGGAQARPLCPRRRGSEEQKQ